jgi:Tfp pilus assembly protein PilN
MPAINMIAAKREEKKRLEQRTRNLVYGIAVEAGLFLVALSYMVVQLVSTQDQVAGLNESIAKLKPQVAQIQGLQDQTALLEPKLTALNDARTNTLYWYTSIENLTDSLTDSSWLVSLQTSGDPSVVNLDGPANNQGPQMQVQGVSLTQSEVGQTMLRMNEYPSFDHVNLTFVQQQQGGFTAMTNGVIPVEFEIAIELHSTTPPASADKTLGADNAAKS